MAKKLLLFISIFFILSACENSKEKSIVNDYDGEQLTIAVVGKNDLAKFNTITYKKMDLSTLMKTPLKEQKFDALIVKSDSFQEADKDKYVGFFNNIKYPVFFYGIEGFNNTAFLYKNSSIKQNYNENAAYVQGYLKHSDGSTTTWNLSLPDNPNKKQKNEEMLKRIFEIVSSNSKETD